MSAALTTPSMLPTATKHFGRAKFFNHLFTSHGIRMNNFLRDQGSGCTIFWDQGPKFVMLMESRIRNLGTKMGLVMKKMYLVMTLLMHMQCL